jgi:hypothetical protein
VGIYFKEFYSNYFIFAFVAGGVTVLLALTFCAVAGAVTDTLVFGAVVGTAT